MKIFGILITRNDDILIEKWMSRHAPIFERLAIVDGSDRAFTKEVVQGYRNVIYLTDPAMVTDQTLRATAWDALKDQAEVGDWVCICHPDEYWIHDPVRFCDPKYDVVTWGALHVLPHPSERAAWQTSLTKDPTELFKHYWWKEDGSMTLEYRMFRVTKDVVWDLVSTKKSSSVIPMNYIGRKSKAPYPIYLHYKCPELDLALYEGSLSAKSGLDTQIGGRRILGLEDFFFSKDNPWGHKGFVHLSDDPTYKKFDKFPVDYRYSPRT